MASPLRYIGLMSGTSLDGIDAAIIEITPSTITLSHSLNHDIPKDLHQQLLSLCTPGDNEIERMGKADFLLGLEFAKAVQQLLLNSGLSAEDIVAIGSHGQTIRHRPDSDTPFTLQIGNPNIISQLCDITTVADFRGRDIAAGGQGAPLAPAFHQAAFAKNDSNRAIVNIGGMANITPLIQGVAQQGFDTGPGNVLMDYWIEKHSGERFDRDGAWARSGLCQEDLLQSFLADQYFALPPPKSTGREHFNSHWLQTHLSKRSDNSADVQATLLQLTAQSICLAIAESIDEIYICGGGAYNSALMQAIQIKRPMAKVATTDSLGIAPEWVEAAAFAWLAHQSINGKTGNIPLATGAAKACVLGAIYPR